MPCVEITCVRRRHCREIEAQEFFVTGEHYTLVDYRALFMWTVHIEVVRRLIVEQLSGWTRSWNPLS
jgi:hypothetical protein